GLTALIFLALCCRLGESLPCFSRRKSSLSSSEFRFEHYFLHERLDTFLLILFIICHVILLRGYLIDPSLVSTVLAGDTGIKDRLQTIPGVTTWTQVSVLLATLRGLRWSGVLPGKVKLFSLFHLTFVSILCLRSLLWLERLALLEAIIPFFLAALPHLGKKFGRFGRGVLQLAPLLVPFLIFFLFILFESFRSWKHYSGDFANIYEFGWRRLFTYYYESLNTGAAFLNVSGFFDGTWGRISMEQAEKSLFIYDNTMEGPLDEEYNNTSCILYLAALHGPLRYWLVIFIAGLFGGFTFRAFQWGRLAGLLYPITFLGVFELLRIVYWWLSGRVMPTALLVAVIFVWATTLRQRISWKDSSPQHQPSLGARS
ncbi:MAG: hypothetical protein AAF191_06905, partial [Verrucomicrobiota bacterium]